MVVPTSFTVATVICRTVATALASAALVCTLRAPDVSFVALVFLKVALLIQLVWNVPRLIYDAAQHFLGLPARGIMFTALVVIEWSAMIVLLAAVCSATGALLFLQVDTRACSSQMSMHSVACSYWHGYSAALTLCAWVFSAIVSGLVFYLRVNAAGPGPIL